jgi:hypothetical protein
MLTQENSYEEKVLSLQVRHGKLYNVRALTEKDYSELQIFCDKCSDLGYENNSSFEKIKLDKMHWPYGQYFIATDGENIFSFAGVHLISELNLNAYRCLFRGAGLSGYSTGKTGLRASYQFIEILNLQIDFVLNHNPNAEFYITTNHSQEKGKSEKMNDIWCPRAEKQGIIELVNDNFVYNYTLQSLWKINVSRYKQWRVL